VWRERPDVCVAHLVSEEDVLHPAHLLQALGQCWVEAWCVDHHVALRAHDEVGLTRNGVNAAPGGTNKHSKHRGAQHRGAHEFTC